MDCVIAGKTKWVRLIGADHGSRNDGGFLEDNFPLGNVPSGDDNSFLPNNSRGFLVLVSYLDGMAVFLMTLPIRFLMLFRTVVNFVTVDTSCRAGSTADIA